MMLFRKKTKKTLPTVHAINNSAPTDAVDWSDEGVLAALTPRHRQRAALRLQLAASFEQGVRETMEDTGVILIVDDAEDADENDDDDEEERVHVATSRSCETCKYMKVQRVQAVAERERRVLCMFGVFDGHGGSETSARLRDSLASEVLTAIDVLSDDEFEDRARLNAAIEDAFIAFDERWRDELMVNVKKPPPSTSGSTALLVIVLASLELLVCNVGDCRAVLRRGERAVPLSRDHLPFLPDERRRVQQSVNGFIQEDLVNGVLQMTRAFGDFELKYPAPLRMAAVVALPEIRRVQLDATDSFVLVACDGLWDVCSNQDVGKFLNTKLDDEGADAPVDALCSELVRTALTRGTMDNTSAILLKIERAHAQ